MSWCCFANSGTPASGWSSISGGTSSLSRTALSEFRFQFLSAGRYTQAVVGLLEISNNASLNLSISGLCIELTAPAPDFTSTTTARVQGLLHGTWGLMLVSGNQLKVPWGFRIMLPC